MFAHIAQHRLTALLLGLNLCLPTAVLAEPIAAGSAKLPALGLQIAPQSLKPAVEKGFVERLSQLSRVKRLQPEWLL